MNYIGQSMVALDHTSCKLKWTPSTATDLDGYYVYMSEFDRNNYKRMTGSPIEEAEWISPPLRSDMDYYFYITAVDSSGNESAPSNIIRFQLPDAVVDSNVRIVEVTPSLMIPGNTQVNRDIDTNNFMTSFTIGG